MITAVDTNIILDVLIPGEPFGKSSKELLDRRMSKGRLILSEVVFAELAARFPSEEELGCFSPIPEWTLSIPMENPFMWPGQDGRNTQGRAQSTGFLAPNAAIPLRQPARGAGRS